MLLWQTSQSWRGPGGDSQDGGHSRFELTFIYIYLCIYPSIKSYLFSTTVTGNILRADVFVNRINRIEITTTRKLIFFSGWFGF